jgi:hypothetical protein
MGNFSWITKNGNPIKIGKPAWMVYKLNDVIYKVKDDEYEGYGVFDNEDYYVVLYKMNFKYVPLTVSQNEQRDYGIDLEI